MSEDAAVVDVGSFGVRKIDLGAFELGTLGTRVGTLGTLDTLGTKRIGGAGKGRLFLSPDENGHVIDPFHTRFDPDEIAPRRVPLPTFPELVEINPLDPFSRVFRVPDRTLPHRPRPAVDGVRRAELTVPLSPSGKLFDEILFEAAVGDGRFALPRYALATDRVADVDEPRILVADRSGTPTLVLALAKTPGPAGGPGVQEMPHVLSVALKISVPDLAGGRIVQEHRFPLVQLDPAGTGATAELPLDSPGLREQLVAAFGSLEAGTTLAVGRGLTVGVPNQQTFPDGEPAYEVRPVLLEQVVPPTPLLLSDAQRARLGGGSAGTGEVQPTRRVRIEFDGRSHPYWQDPVRPDHFWFIPDRFLLARLGREGRGPQLRVSAADATDEAELAVTVEFAARPVVDPARLAAALPELEKETIARGGTGPVRLERLQEAQPLLRLALPRNGAAAAGLTERPGTEIDLEVGLVHAETLALDDFRLVYEALFGASLSLLRGEVRVGAGTASPEDIPLELRLDHTTGDVLELAADPVTGPAVTGRLTNAIESTIVIGALPAVALCDGGPVPLAVTGLAAGTSLAPGASCAVVLTPTGPFPGKVNAVVLDQSTVAVQPDRTAIWTVVFDTRTEGRLTRTLQVQAVPAMFTGAADRPGDQVLVFVLTVENGGSASLTEAVLTAPLTVRVPVQPLLTGAPLPPIRYRTETHWQSGGIGVSEWRQTDATILLPVRTGPQA